MQLAQRLGCRGGVGRRTVHSAATELCWPRAPLNNSSAVRQLQHTTACRAVAAQQPPAPRLDLQDLSCPVPAQQQQQSAQELPAEIKAVLFSEAQVAAKVREMGAAICADYAGKQVAIIGVLNGAFIFTSDLVREVSKAMPDVKVDFLRASSYGSASSSSGDVTVQATSDLQKWAGYHILLVEDIIDSGHTLNRLSGVLSSAGAASVKVVALLDKKGRRRVEFFPDYVGWECPSDAFVVGMGMDWAEKFRCLPYIAALREEVYEQSGP